MRIASSSLHRLILLSAFLLAFLAVFNFSTFTLYNKAKNYLDNELGERLQSIAVVISHTLELADMDSLSEDAFSLEMLSTLHAIRSENLLSNILILTADGKTVFDLSRLSEPGEYNPFVDLDFSAVTLARSGFSSSTKLYRSGDSYLKSAYAPVHSVDNTIAGMINVEAGAGYFDVLRSLRTAIIIVDLASFLAILILAALFYKQSLSLDKAMEAVLRGETLAAMGRMVAAIAHEIRNPLSIIKTSAERIQKQHNIDDETITFITEEVDKLNRILTGYLNFAKEGHQHLKPRPFQKIILRSLMLVENDVSRNNIVVSKSLPSEELFIYCDEQRLQQALLNILLNAVQALSEGGRVEVALRARRNRAVLTIKDNGPGMTSKHLQEIRKPFYTTKKQGSGLGLSITNNIIETHNGTMEIGSAPGEGTTVILSIPMSQPSDMKTYSSLGAE